MSLETPCSHQQGLSCPQWSAETDFSRRKLGHKHGGAITSNPPCVYYMRVRAQSCPTVCDPADCSAPGSSVPGILQAGTLEWVAISFPRGIFSTQGSNLLHLLLCRQILYLLSHQGYWRQKHNPSHKCGVDWESNPTASVAL